VNLTEGEASGLSGPDVLRLFIEVADAERERCAALAEEYGTRLTTSGKHNEAMVAITIAAQIRARK